MIVLSYRDYPHNYVYVPLEPPLYNDVKARLGHEMKHGVLNDGTEYMQEKHVRYIKA